MIVSAKFENVTTYRFCNMFTDDVLRLVSVYQLG